MKTRPEPPVRKTPEYPPSSAHSSSSSSSTRKTFTSLEVDTGKRTPSGSGESEDKRAATPSPPPPAPQMQLHYPYPGMQGNTHHPPIRGPGPSNLSSSSSSSSQRTFGTPPPPPSSAFSASSQLRSPTSPTSHQFPYAQQRLPGVGGVALRFGGSVRKISAPQQPQPTPQQRGSIFGRSAAPRMVIAGRSQGGPSGGGGAAAAAGNLYINGK